MELQSENLADAKTEAARHITSATAKVTIYENRDDREELVPLSYVNVYADEELEWHDLCLIFGMRALDWILPADATSVSMYQSWATFNQVAFLFLTLTKSGIRSINSRPSL